MSRIKYIISGAFGSGIALLSLIFYANMGNKYNAKYYQTPAYNNPVAVEFMHKRKGKVQLRTFELINGIARRDPALMNEFFVNNTYTFDVDKFRDRLYNASRDIIVDNLIAEEHMSVPANQKEVTKLAMFMTYLNAFYLNQPLNLDVKKSTEEVEDRFAVWKITVNTKEEINEILSVVKVSKRVPVLKDLLKVASLYCLPVEYSAVQPRGDNGLSKAELMQKITPEEMKLIEETDDSVSKVIEQTSSGRKQFTIFYIQKGKGPRSASSFTPIYDHEVVSKQRDEFIKSKRINVVAMPKNAKECLDNPKKVFFSVQDYDITDEIPSSVQAKDIIGMCKMLFPNQKEFTPTNIRYAFGCLLFVYTCAILAKESHWNPGYWLSYYETEASVKLLKYMEVKSASSTVKEVLIRSRCISVKSDSIGKKLTASLNNNPSKAHFESLNKLYNVGGDSFEGFFKELEQNFGSVFEVKSGNRIKDADQIKVGRIYGCYDKLNERTTFILVENLETKEINKATTQYDVARKNMMANLG